MNNELVNLIYHLADPLVSEASVITWGSPVISFGNLNSSKIATLGLNPSNREFIDNKGNELVGDKRRFHTLNSLGLKSWTEATEDHLNSIIDTCENYFYRNPYDGWFRKLDYLISGTAISYYFPSSEACHLDLIPYATSFKWTDISNEHKSFLLELSAKTLGLLLKKSSIQILILNGQSVVDNLEKIAAIKLNKKRMCNWTLPRKEDNGVSGYSYTGTIDNFAGIQFDQKIEVLGYNHNVQSSFGVTNEVQTAIRSWITKKAKEIINETR